LHPFSAAPLAVLDEPDVFPEFIQCAGFALTRKIPAIVAIVIEVVREVVIRIPVILIAVIPVTAGVTNNPIRDFPAALPALARVVRVGTGYDIFAGGAVIAFPDRLSASIASVNSAAVAAMIVS